MTCGCCPLFFLLDADYKVATQKSAALADEAKSSCVAAAKTKFGK